MGAGDNGPSASTTFLSGMQAIVDGLIAQGVNAAAGAGGKKQADPIWWDNVATAPAGGGLSEHSQGVLQPTRLNEEAQAKKIYSYFADPNKRLEFGADLYRIGAMNDSRGFNQVGYFTNAAANALDVYKASGSNMPFTEWLATEASKSTRKLPMLDGSDKQKKVPYTGPVKQWDFTPELDARAIVNNALGQYLGRQATDEEVAAFTKKLNETESANPQVATPQGHDVVRTGGVSATGATEIAKEFAMGQSDYAETQASTTLMGWLRDAVVSDKNARVI